MFSKIKNIFNNKNKELELRERELELKVKEIALKEKELRIKGQIERNKKLPNQTWERLIPSS